MKITDKRSGEHAYFGDLQVGDVFEWMEEYYVVIPHILDCDTENHYNAFSFSNDVLDHFDNDIEVVKINAELVIT